MLEFIRGLFVDLSIIGGIILFAVSFSNKYRIHRTKLLVAGIILIIAGFIFIDGSAIAQAYQNGLEWGKN